MNTIQTIVFDLDGTLLDTLGDLTAAVNHTMVLHGFPERTVGEVRRFVGNGVAKLMELSVPGGADNPLLAQCLREFSAYYENNMTALTKPYDGVPELLGKLKAAGFQMAVVSNKFDAAVKTLCRHYFGATITVAVGESADAARKPAPDTVFKALAELGVDAKSAVYIGDSEVDILTAKNAGLPCVSVGWGFRDAEFLKSKGAGAVLRHPGELPEALKKL